VVACRVCADDGVAIETLTDSDGGIQIKPSYRAGHSQGAFVVPCLGVDRKESRGQRSVMESLPDRGLLRQLVRCWVRKYPLNLANLAKVST
jgi:hypothetical protein